MGTGVTFKIQYPPLRNLRNPPDSHRPFPQQTTASEQTPLQTPAVRNSSTVCHSSPQSPSSHRHAQPQNPPPNRPEQDSSTARASNTPCNPTRQPYSADVLPRRSQPIGPRPSCQSCQPRTRAPYRPSAAHCYTPDTSVSSLVCEHRHLPTWRGPASTCMNFLGSRIRSFSV